MKTWGVPLHRSPQGPERHAPPQPQPMLYLCCPTHFIPSVPHTHGFLIGGLRLVTLCCTLRPGLHGLQVPHCALRVRTVKLPSILNSGDRRNVYCCGQATLSGAVHGHPMPRAVLAGLRCVDAMLCTMRDQRKRHECPGSVHQRDTGVHGDCGRKRGQGSSRERHSVRGRRSGECLVLRRSGREAWRIHSCSDSAITAHLASTPTPSFAMAHGCGGTQVALQSVL
jgi:hypothetical protein